MINKPDTVALALRTSKREQRRFLQSVVDVARAIFDAQASSIFLLEASGRYLVFQAVSGAGSTSLIGQRFPVDHGVAGWVLASREPVAVRDVSSNPRFARGFAESTGFVPRTILATPLLHDDRAVGVLEVLDSDPERTRILGDLELLALFAGQASAAIDLLHRVSVAVACETDGAGPADVERATLMEIAEALDTVGAQHRDPAVRLLVAARDLLVRAPGAEP